MKRIFLIVVALLGFGTAVAQAQLSITPRVEAGVNLATLTGSGDDFTSTKVGLRTGAALEIGFKRWGMVGLYFAPGITYKMDGTEYEPLLLFWSVKHYDLRMHTLAMPLKLGVRFNFARHWALSAELGPQLGYGLSAKQKVTATSPLLPGVFTTEGDPYKDGSLKRFDVGISESVAIEYRRFYFRLGAEHGLINLAKIGGSVHNFNVYTMLGFRF